MKRTILVVLMAVMIATPCFAQEIEPVRLFSIEGTLWRIGTETHISTRPPFVTTYERNGTFGFYQRTVYGCSVNEECSPTSLPYINSPVLAISYQFSFGYFALMLLQPSGIGGNYHPKPGQGMETFFYYTFAPMFKVDDNWKPPEVE